MRITVIGRSPAWQDAGGACSGYLVDQDGTSLLIDCGSGVFARLRELRDHRSIDSVVISHMHGDHVLDLIPFSYGLLYGPELDGPPPRLFLPPGGLATMRTICGAFGNETLVEEAFIASEYDPSGLLEVGVLTLGFQLVEHFIDAWAISATADGAGRFVFGADTGPCEGLVDFAGGADLLMLEATLPAGSPESDGHLTPAQAGGIANSAGAAKLVLTHASDFLDLEESVRAAAEVFDGPVEMALDGSAWDL